MELILFKKDALEYLCGAWLDSIASRKELKQQIREKCKSVNTFREACGYSFATRNSIGLMKVSSNWKVGWTGAEDKVLELIEACHVGLLALHRYLIPLRIPIPC